MAKTMVAEKVAPRDLKRVGSMVVWRVARTVGEKAGSKDRPSADS